MIIGFHSIQCSSGVSKTSSHIFHGEKNEKITVLNGNEETLKDIYQDSLNHNHKYFCLHSTISPEKDMSNEQLKNVVQNICKEFKRDEKECVLIEHQKPRSDGTISNKHYHLILPYTNPETGTQLNFRNKNPRGEKISREYEIENNETLTQGKHNWSVLKTFEKEGKQQCVEKMKLLIAQEKDHIKRSHSRSHQQKLERKNISLPNEKNNILQLYKSSSSMSSFLSSMKEQGYDIKEGEKKNTYIVEKDGNFLGSCDRLIGMKKKEFNEKYNKEINENVQSIPEKSTPKKIRFKDQGEDQNPEEANPTQHTETATRTPKIRFTRDRRVWEKTDDNQPRDTKEYGQNSKSVRRSRFNRTESTPPNSSRYPEKSINNFGRNKEIERELKKLEREIKNNKFRRIQEKNIRKYENKKLEKQQKENEKILSEQQILLKIIEQLCNRLFGTPTQKQKDVVHNLIINSHKNKELLIHIVNSELKDVSFPKSLSEEKLKNLSESQKIKEISNIKKIYSSQMNFINDLNKKYNLNLPNPSFKEFLENHQNRNSLCKELLIEENKKFEKEKSLNILQKYIDKCEENTRLKHNITDIEIIKKDISDNLFSSYKSSMSDYDKIEKEFNDINIKFFDKYFNKEKINQKNSLSEKLNNLKDEMNKKEDKYNHFSNFENEISKSESDKRIKENDEIKKNWKYKKSLENLPILKNLQSRLSMNDNELIDKINNGELKNILSDEIQKIRDSQKLEEQKKNMEQKENVLSSEKSDTFQMKR